MKKLNTILLIMGLVSLVWLVCRIDAAQVWRELRSLSWGLIPFVLGEGVAEMIHTLGWRHCLSGPYRSLPWRLLFRMRMAGYAINYVTPTANLGGDVSRAALLASNQRGPEAVSGVLIEKVCFGLAQIIFVAVGCILFVSRIHLPSALLIPMLASSALVFGGLVAFLILQRCGMLGGLIRWLTKRARGSKKLETTTLNVTRVDDALRTFYRERPLDFWRAAAWHLIGFSVGVLQAWLFLRLLHLHDALPTATLIFCLGMWFDLLTFAIPLNAGALEGGRTIAVIAVGYSAVLGLTYGVAVRVSQVFWAVLGLLAYGTLVTGKRNSPPRDSLVPGARRISSAGPHFGYPARRAGDLP
jgi:uncharacterized membrane protein YbhN (UPF0104 family)